MIIENDFSNQVSNAGTQRDMVIQETSLERTQSAKIAKQIDQVHQEHQRRKGVPGTSNLPSSIINNVTSMSQPTDTIQAGAPAPSQNFTSTILHYKE